MRAFFTPNNVAPDADGLYILRKKKVEWIYTWGGDDLIRDLGGSDSRVYAGGGRDHVIFDVGGNLEGRNFYHGGRGRDTFDLEFDRDEWMALGAQIQSDLSNLENYLSGNTRKLFKFDSFDLRLKHFENVRVFVDGEELSLTDDPVVASDDAETITENASIAASVVSNDVVPDLIRMVELVGSGPAAGALTLGADGSYSFETGTDFDWLGAGQTSVVSFDYRVTDASGDSDVATVSITVVGENDDPEMADASVDVLEGAVPLEVDLTALGSDLDSDDDGTTLTYTITGAPASGVAQIVGGTLRFDPASNVPPLALDERLDVTVEITATDRHGATATGEVSVTIIGTNEDPVAVADILTVVEDTATLLDLLANDTDADPGDVLEITGVTGALNGSTEIVGGAMVRYTPDDDFSGVEHLSYTISDGKGGSASGMATVNVDGRAEVPTVDYELIAGATADTFVLRVTAEQTDLDGSEFIDRISLSATGADGNPLAGFAGYVNQTTINPAGQDGQVTADFLFNLPKGTAQDFDVTITAFAAERSNGHEASGTAMFDIETSGAANSVTNTFSSTGQSIWAQGNAFNWSNSYTAGGSAGGGGSVGTSIIGPIDTRIAGVGVTTHFSTALNGGANVELAIENEVGVSGGSVDTVLNYTSNFATTYNRTLDQLSIETSAFNNLVQSGFTASTPNITFEQSLTDLAFSAYFGIYVWGYLQAHYTVGTQSLINYPDINDGWKLISPSLGVDVGALLGDGLSLVRYDGNSLSFLEGYHSTSQYAGTKEDGLGNELFSWLFQSHAFQNQSDTVQWANGKVSGTNSRDFATITFDMDGIASSIKGIANPVHQEFSAGQGPLSFSAFAEVLDLDLVMPVAYRQDNALKPGALWGTIVYEDASTQSFQFGSTLNVQNASSLDVNGDGNIGYKFYVRPDATFETSANLDISLYDSLDILSLGIQGSFSPLDDVLDFTPLNVNKGPAVHLDRQVIDEHYGIQLASSSFTINTQTIELDTWVV